ncbi:MAG: energy transducer TonB [Bacteroidetes bacterium]|nr:energy transducer TonB [Bacteroidota bacterium]
MNEDRQAILLSVTIHAILLLLAWFVALEPQTRFQTSMLEVTYGELEQGRPLPPNEPVEEEAEATTETEEEMAPEAPNDPEPVEAEPTPEPEPTETTPEPEPEPVEPQLEPEPTPEPEIGEDPETPVDDPTQPQYAVEQPETEPKTPVEETPAIDAEEGDATDDELQSPYELKWEGELGRDPRVQPLPVNRTNTDATITIRFEVNPDGSIGRTLPIQRMNPELEREVMRTLRNWRFNPLPSRVPQEAQWGTITFRFVVE